MRPYEAPTVTLLGRIESRTGGGFIVVTVDYWSLHIAARTNGTFDAELISPTGKGVYTSHFRPTSAEAVERATSYLERFLGEARAAQALRAMAQAETVATGLCPQEQRS